MGNVSILPLKRDLSTVYYNVHLPVRQFLVGYKQRASFWDKNSTDPDAMARCITTQDE